MLETHCQEVGGKCSVRTEPVEPFDSLRVLDESLVPVAHERKRNHPFALSSSMPRGGKA
jgi:hypothetical protein